eukprot:ANDGO_01179.mRNA.1 hypothetical protein
MEISNADVCGFCSTSSSSINSANQSVPYRRGHILIIANDRDDQRDVLRLLNELGYSREHHVILSKNGEDALSKLRSEHLPFAFDVVLLDCPILAIMDGFNIVQEIRDYEKRTAPFPGMMGADSAVYVPIIAMIPADLSGGREVFSFAGCSDVLRKPVVPKTLSALIKAYDTPIRVAIAEYTKIEILGGDADAFGEIVESFLANTPSLMTSFKKSIQNSDVCWDSVIPAVHMLGECTLYVGACRLYGLCSRFSFMMRELHPPSCSEKLSPTAIRLCFEIAAEYDLVLQDVLRFI